MLDEDASSRRAEGKIAECFRRLHPARGNSGNDGNYRNNARMKCGGRQWRSAEGEHVEGSSEDRDKREQQQSKAFKQAENRDAVSVRRLQFGLMCLCYLFIELYSPVR